MELCFYHRIKGNLQHVISQIRLFKYKLRIAEYELSIDPLQGAWLTGDLTNHNTECEFIFQLFS